jgi:uncharacterized protein YkwD
VPVQEIPSATLTPFLPRGFENLPTETSALPIPTLGPVPTISALDPTLVLARLNRLRAGEGAAPLERVVELDEIAQKRAEAIAASGSLRHMDEAGQGAGGTGELTAAGFSGYVGELVLSVAQDRDDPIGLVLQALLTDPANRSLAFSPRFRFAGFGLGEGNGSWYVVGLLAENAQSE